MHTFWTFARRMLRHRGLLAAALVFATLSAGGLGAGLLGLYPILENLLPAKGMTPKTLAELLGPPLARLSEWGINIPTSWLASLPTDPFLTVFWVVVGLGVLTVIGAACNFLHAWCSLTIVSRVIANIRRDAFRRAIHLPLRTVVQAGTTDTISRIVYDTATLASGLNALLSKAIAQITKGAAALVVAFALDWRLAGVALIVAPVLATVMRKLGKRIRRASRSALQSQAGLYRAAAEVLSGLRVVKVYTTERAEAGRFHRINKEVVRQELKVRTARALSSPLIETLTIFVLGVLALVAAKAIMTGDLDARRFLLVFGALGMAAAQLKPLTGFINDIQQASAAADRIGQLLSLATEPGHGRDGAGRRLPALARHRESIVFEHVTFTYPGADAPALRDVSLTIRRGETVAIVGPNGSGKTTLLSLVPRLFDPDQGGGRVLVDGTDIRGVAVRSLRRQVGVVTQEIVLFHDTIRANIAYGVDGPGATDGDIRSAARRARAEEFILEKPRGYDEMVGEGGASLSGGQRQRIAIARAVLRDPAILILDEATSMIDADSEAKIAAAIADFVRSPSQHGSDGDVPSARTCLIVAHRLSTVMNADRIVVMDAGRVVDQGRHDELLKRCAVYKLIAQNQLLRPRDPEAGDQGLSGDAA